MAKIYLLPSTRLEPENYAVAPWRREFGRRIDMYKDKNVIFDAYLVQPRDIINIYIYIYIYIQLWPKRLTHYDFWKIIAFGSKNGFKMGDQCYHIVE